MGEGPKYSLEEARLLLEVEPPSLAKIPKKPRKPFDWPIFGLVVGSLIVLVCLGLAMHAGLSQESDRKSQLAQVATVLTSHGFPVRRIIKKRFDSECNLPDGHIYNVKYGCVDMVSHCEESFCCNSEKCLAVDGSLPSPRPIIIKE